jgi:hypothetical protein
MAAQQKQPNALIVGIDRSFDVTDCDCLKDHPTWMKSEGCSVGTCARFLWPIYVVVQIGNFAAMIYMLLEGEAQYNRVRPYTGMEDGKLVTVEPIEDPDTAFACTDAPAMWEYMRLMGIWGLLWSITAPGVAICFTCDQTKAQIMPGVKRCVSMMGCFITIGLAIWGSLMVFGLSEMNDCMSELVDFNKKYLTAFWIYMGFSFVVLPVFFAFQVVSWRKAHPPSSSSVLVIPADQA